MKKLINFLGLVSKSGQIVFGFDEVTKKARMAIFITNDVVENTLNKLSMRTNATIYEMNISSDELSKAIGKPEKGVKLITATNRNMVYKLIELTKEED